MGCIKKEDRARRFAEIILALYGHEGYFEFDLLGHPFEPIKLALELSGYSVHRNRCKPHLVAAFRVEQDLAPIHVDPLAHQRMMA